MSQREMAAKSGGADGLTVQLIRRFKLLFCEGALRPGVRLPSERDLALRFGVSRGSLRPALKVLQIMGVITQRTGHGTFVAESASAVLAESMEFLVLFDSVSDHELFDARLLFEPELTARAAERATADDLRSLKASLREMARAGPDPIRVPEIDLEFHRVILRAAGNKVYLAMLTAIHSILLTSISRIARLADVKHTMRFHSAIYDAIYARDAEGARARMREHLEDARQLMLDAASSEQRIAGGQLSNISLRQNLTT
jgi:GntR family transcriptional repressor for pyruvate dehydrogenase complex